MLYTRLLVPLDGSAESEAALAPAGVLARALNAEAVLLRVVDDASEGDAQAGEYLNRVATTLTGIQTQVAVARGDTAETIAAETVSRAADLIVMATHTRGGGLEHLLVGRTSERIVADSRVPVVLTRPGTPPMARLERMLVAVDGSPGGLVALGAAARLARAVHASIRVLRVVSPLPLWIYDPTLGLNTGPLIDPRWDESRREHAETYVNQVATQVAESGLEVTADALVGDVPATIVDQAVSQAADLIVMGTHARVGIARAALGSTAADVVKRAAQPVLLARREWITPS